MNSEWEALYRRAHTPPPGANPDTWQAEVDAAGAAVKAYYDKIDSDRRTQFMNSEQSEQVDPEAPLPVDASGANTLGGSAAIELTNEELDKDDEDLHADEDA